MKVIQPDWILKVSSNRSRFLIRSLMHLGLFGGYQRVKQVLPQSSLDGKTMTLCSMLQP